MIKKVTEEDKKHIKPILYDMFNSEFTFLLDNSYEGGHFYSIINKNVITAYYEKMDSDYYLEIYTTKNIFENVINMAENNSKYGVITDIVYEDRVLIFILYDDLKNIDI